MIFDPLTGATLLVLAASGDGLCTMPKPTEIDVKASSKSLRYDYSKSLDDIQGVAVDTINPHSFDGISMTQGFMNGAIKLVPKVELDYKVYTQAQMACIWYDKITITMEIDPTITIAREVKADRCMGQAVKDHEMKHVKVDREIVNKYSNIIGREVKDELEKRGYMAGPVNADDVEDIAKRMQQTVFQVVEHQYKKMEIERIERQADVDTIEEYERVSAECPDFNPASETRRKSRR